MSAFSFHPVGQPLTTEIEKGTDAMCKIDNW